MGFDKLPKSADLRLLICILKQNKDILYILNFKQDEKLNCYSVYILASKKNGTLYTGVTNDLGRRVYEHKQKKVPGFTQQYNVDKLVYVEEFADISDAIAREKIIKKWSRVQKLYAIETQNPQWNDLYEGLM